MLEEARYVLRIPRRTRCVDRKRHHLVVGAIDEEMKTLGPNALTLEHVRELHCKIVGSRQHIIDETDGFGVFSLSIAINLRQSWNEPFLDMAQCLIETQDEA